MPAFLSSAYVQRGIKVLLLNTVIAMGITLFDQHTLVKNLVYSHCIGLSIWAYIEVAICLWVGNWHAHASRLVWIVPAAVVLGYFSGIFLTDALLGSNSLSIWKTSPRYVMGMLFISLVASGVISWAFVSREQRAAERQQLEAARRQASEAQLKLLEAQLEPHMLFNTLANLRALIALDPARAQTMLDHLIAYLRATLAASRSASTDGHQHTLADEFARLQDYLELMAIRMGPRLQYQLDLPESLSTQPVPPLLLQPLVENSIQHGLEPKVAGGSIRISAGAADGMLALEVLDTGLGADMAKLQAAPHTAAGQGFGLQQVRERLATTYGHHGAMVLIAPPAGGTRVSITFPIKN
ncbi:histidine kinase [Curvibacter sp. CHRR-16]|uniref:sensor histidine kinase n=1 Tax=Curvibacter sp. CHRR-16 TaxID=2835872 RepID=UPI001BD9656C|nr:histidine kinase [Curvibacter sp. CHRR-16]MBT0571076.1 histidine kinase [Curvibacter sp. CHRR-16]